MRGLADVGRRLAGPSALARSPLPQFGLGSSEELPVFLVAVLADGAPHVGDQVGGRGEPASGADIAERLPQAGRRAEMLERGSAPDVLLCGHKVIVSNLLRRVKRSDTLLVHGSTLGSIDDH